LQEKQQTKRDTLVRTVLGDEDADLKREVAYTKGYIDALQFVINAPSDAVRISKILAAKEGNS
jgi:hypothetical protein